MKDRIVEKDAVMFYNFRFLAKDSSKDIDKWDFDPYAIKYDKKHLVEKPTGKTFKTELGDIISLGEATEDLTKPSSQRLSRTDNAKIIGMIAAASGGAWALFISDDERIKVVGGVILIGGLVYPFVEDMIGGLIDRSRRKDTSK